MITAAYIPSPRIKKISGVLADLIKIKHNLVDLTIIRPGNQESYKKINGKILPDRYQRQNHPRQFKEWCMPEPEAGYIRASKHNLL